MMVRLALTMLVTLLLACSQEATAPTATPTMAPITQAITPAVTEPVPTAVRPEPTPTSEPTPVPTLAPTSPPVVAAPASLDDLYGPEAVWAKVLIPPPANDPKIVDYLTYELVGIDGSFGLYTGRESLAERILTADVIARVSLVTKRTSAAQRPGSLWGALLEFRFRVHEYLKGSGPSEIGGLVYIEYPGDDSEANARQAATQIADAHDSRWDDREAIVFLWLDDPDSPPDIIPSYPRGSGQYWLGSMALGPIGEAYTVASQYRQAWLPEVSQTQGQAGTRQTEQVFLLDASSATAARGAVGDAATIITVPTISLSNLKTKVTTLNAEANVGGTSEYRTCVEHAYYRQRRAVYDVSQKGTPLEQNSVTLSSTDPAGSVLHTTYMATTSTDISSYYWYGGPDNEIVRPKALGPLTGHQTILRVGHATKRPLPAGSYSFFYNWTNPVCPQRLAGADNHYRIDVTVTAPAGTLHEAFFDPVAIGNALGADGTSGVLDPNAFSLDGATTTISSLKWESGAVTMTLSPTASLAGYAVDFIALDGSVTTTLAVDDATQSGGTLTWTASNKPWGDGDKLMLRIRPRPSIAISGLDASIEAGQTDTFTVSASNLATTMSYGIRVTTDDSDIGFDGACADRQEDTTVPAASTSHSAAFTLHACSTPGGTVTATLLEGTTAVATTTQDVTVTAAPPPPQHAPAPTGLSVDSSTQTSISLSWSPVQDAHRYKLERSPNGTSGWSDADDISGTSHTLSGLSCATTVHFRVSARGDGSPYSTTFGAPSTASVSGTTSDCTSTTTPVATPTPTTTAPSPPAFASSTYSFTVAENASAFDLVGTVSADDPDGGAVTYSIVAGNDEGKFEITLNAGEIVVWGALDYDTTSSYALTVRATDSSGATSTVVVNISVTDVP